MTSSRGNEHLMLCFHYLLSSWRRQPHDMRNEIKQSKQIAKKLRDTDQVSKKEMGAKKTNYIEEDG
jgi:hypothetical protein